MLSDSIPDRLCKVDLQKHPQGTRFVVLTLLNGLMSIHRDGMSDNSGGVNSPTNLKHDSVEIHGRRVCDGSG